MRRLIAAGFAAFVLVAAAGCGGAASPSGPPSSAPSTAPSTGTTGCAGASQPVTNPVTVSIADRTYHPDPVQAKVGQPIQWHNDDNVPHTATLDGSDCGTNQLAGGQDGALVFAAAGTYAYHCKVHSSMHGTITIAP